MKTLKIFAIALISFFITTNIQAQNAKNEVIDIKVSSQCSMCKETIERTLAFEKGIVKADVDLETDVVKVTYKKSKTTPEAIKKAISFAGYDADEVPADPKAYAKLSDCCKKPEDRVNKTDVHDHH
jgi:mercuric ion binding protein